MKASDIRIGSTIRKADNEIWQKKFRGAIVQATIGDLQMMLKNPQFFEPVELNVETIKALRFEHHVHTWPDGSVSEDDWWMNGYFLIFNDDNWMLCKVNVLDQNPQFLTSIRYVHQLENLLFTMTGDENLLLRISSNIK